MSHKRFIDIGANLVDPVFRGVYRGKRKHQDDLADILLRAKKVGVSHAVVTGGSLQESKHAIDLCKEFKEGISPVKLGVTVGCHPTRTNEMISNNYSCDKYLEDLLKLIEDNPTRVAAIGEFGLDYDRLNFSDKDTQLLGFERQLDTLVLKYGNGFNDVKPLPLFLHCRAAEEDFIRIISKYRDSFVNAVVHSFTGSWSECKLLLDMGLYIGINGCSLKTEENLDVVRQIPIDRMMLETDCPYCEIRPSHVSHKLLASSQDKSLKPSLCNADKWKADCLVRGRNEPCRIIDVFEVVSKLKQERDSISEDGLAERIYNNTLSVFENIAN